MISIFYEIWTGRTSKNTWNIYNTCFFFFLFGVLMMAQEFIAFVYFSIGKSLLLHILKHLPRFASKRETSTLFLHFQLWLCCIFPSGQMVKSINGLAHFFFNFFIFWNCIIIIIIVCCCCCWCFFFLPIFSLLFQNAKCS